MGNSWDLVFAFAAILTLFTSVIFISLLLKFIRWKFKKRRMVQYLQRRMTSKKGKLLQYTFIVNPSKKLANRAVETIKEFFETENLPSPSFLETEINSPGYAQAVGAAENGSDIVVAVGGDGTARSVAHGLAGKNACFGIIPIGTANIFARNIGLHKGEIEKSLLTITGGHIKALDIGFAEVKNVEGQPWKINNKEPFLAVAGLGFDAAMIAATSEKLKKKIGWLAYFTGSFRQVRTSRIDLKIDMLSADGITHHIYEAKMRSLLFGNCSKIPGLTLIPDARADDGKLDFLAIDTKANILGWGQIFSKILMQTAGLKQKNLLNISSIEHKQGLQARIKSSTPAYLQIDGDIIGKTTELKVSLESGALAVLIPEV